MLLTHFMWQTVLKQLSGTNAKNGTITPSLTPTMQARCYKASDGGRKHRTCLCCRQGVCGGFGTRRPSNQEAFCKRPRGGCLEFYYFDDSFTSTRCLYLSPSQLCLIKRICTSYARTRTHTCPCAYACARTLAARESRQKCMRMDTGRLSELTEYSRGGASLQSRRGVSL